MRLEALNCDGAAHKKMVVNDSDVWGLTTRALLLSNDVSESVDGKLRGDPTEVAVYQAIQQAGYQKTQLLIDLPRIDEIPFDAGRKQMTTIHQHDDAYISFTKGAAESLIDICENVLTSGGLQAPDKMKFSNKFSKWLVRVIV